MYTLNNSSGGGGGGGRFRFVLGKKSICFLIKEMKSRRSIEGGREEKEICLLSKSARVSRVFL